VAAMKESGGNSGVKMKKVALQPECSRNTLKEGKEN
jgi:hypothetical protein